MNTLDAARRLTSLLIQTNYADRAENLIVPKYNVAFDAGKLNAAKVTHHEKMTTFTLRRALSLTLGHATWRYGPRCVTSNTKVLNEALP